MAIFQADFRDITLDEESTWKMVVLIPKGNGRDFRGIGLVEVLWKTTMGLLNQRFTLEIGLHDVFHGF